MFDPSFTSAINKKMKAMNWTEDLGLLQQRNPEKKTFDFNLSSMCEIDVNDRTVDRVCEIEPYWRVK